MLLTAAASAADPIVTACLSCYGGAVDMKALWATRDSARKFRLCTNGWSPRNNVDRFDVTAIHFLQSDRPSVSDMHKIVYGSHDSWLFLHGSAPFPCATAAAGRSTHRPRWPT